MTTNKLLGIIAACSATLMAAESATSIFMKAPKPLVGKINAQVTPYKKTSFETVTSKLHPNGDFYMYMSTGQMMNKVGKYMADWSKALTQVQTRKRKPINLQLFTSIFTESGISEIEAIGLSSVPVSAEFFNRKTVIYHQPGKAQGMIWKLFGLQNHDLKETQKLLPSNTVMASFNNIDLKILLKWIDSQMKKSGDPKLAMGFDMTFAMIQQIYGINVWNALESLDQQIGTIVTINPKERFAIPNSKINIGEPAIAFVLKVKDSSIYNTINRLVPPEFTRNETGDSKSIEIALPDSPKFVKPTIVQAGNLLIIGLNKKICNDILTARKRTEGFAKNEEFINMSTNIPANGVAFDYVSPRAAKIIKNFTDQIKEQVKRSQQVEPGAEKITELVTENMFTIPATYSVLQTSSEGFVTSANTDQTSAQILASTAIVPAAFLAGISMPYIVRTREVAKAKACMTNLQQIREACEAYEMETGKKAISINVLVKKGFLSAKPLCASGGHYYLIDGKPSCTCGNH